MAKGYILVEGQGDIEAAGNLIARLWNELGAPFPWARPIRWKNLHRPDGLRRGAEYIRRRGDARALLVLRDEDDRCPREEAPRMAKELGHLKLPCPAAAVLLYREYEVLFLPCIEQMAGRPLRSVGGERPGIVEGTTWEGDWERLRGIKEWLTAHFPASRAYKPTVDQLPLTQMLDLATLRDAGLSSFVRLERALKFLKETETPGRAYPSPRARPS